MQSFETVSRRLDVGDREFFKRHVDRRTHLRKRGQQGFREKRRQAFAQGLGGRFGRSLGRSFCDVGGRFALRGPVGRIGFFGRGGFRFARRSCGFLRLRLFFVGFLDVGSGEDRGRNGRRGRFGRPGRSRRGRGFPVRRFGDRDANARKRGVRNRHVALEPAPRHLEVSPRNPRFIDVHRDVGNREVVEEEGNRRAQFRERRRGFRRSVGRRRQILRAHDDLRPREAHVVDDDSVRKDRPTRHVVGKAVGLKTDPRRFVADVREPQVQQRPRDIAHLEAVDRPFGAA